MDTTPPLTTIIKESPAPVFALTVVTVCRNALADLKPTVESVLAQKAQGTISIEHVVVDGASTDGTAAWLEEQRAAGNIERYVSEPDAGIYDAMNKGINLARGAVLAFLNAGDTYRADADLAACVQPIVEGCCVATAATALICGGILDGQFFRPRYNVRYLAEPCSHQAFFTTTALYRELGGYDTSYHCAADTDLIYRMCSACECPRTVDAVVVDFQAGGFSANCHENYRDEYLELLWRNREQAMELCRQDKDYRDEFLAMLCDHCFNLQHWQQARGKQIPRQIENLATICLKARELAKNATAKVALRYMGAVYLPRLARLEPLPAGTKWKLLLCQFACAPARNNPYRKEMSYPRITPLNFVLYWIGRGIHSLKSKLHK